MSEYCCVGVGVLRSRGEGIGPQLDGVAVAAHEVKARVALDLALVEVPRFVSEKNLV